MSWLEKTKHAMTRFIKRDAVFDNPDAWSPADFPSWFYGTSYNAARALNGGAISEQNALRIATVYTCVRIISETIATLPLVLYKEDKDGGKKPADHLPEYYLLHDSPNVENTNTDFIESLVASLLLQGNGYAWTPRDPDGKPQALWFLRPDAVSVSRVDGHLVYKATGQDNVPRTLFQGDSMLHIKSYSHDGVRGLSVIGLHGKTMAVSMSQEDYTANLYKNGVNARGVLETDQPLESRDFKALRKLWRETYGGAKNSGETIVLPFNAKFQQISMTPEDAQMIQGFNYQERQICKLFRVPLHMVGNLEKSAFSNIEQQSLEFVMYCLRPWCVRIENSLNTFFLTRLQRQRGLFYKFNLSGLLRGATTDRFNSYQIGINSGIYLPNEVRAMEDLNPVPGGDKMRPPPNASIGTAKPTEDPNAKDQEEKAAEEDQASGDKQAQDQEDPPAKPKKKKDKKALNVAELALIDGIKDAFERAEAKERKFLERTTDPVKVSTFYAEHSNYLFNIVAPNVKRAATGLGASVDTPYMDWLEKYCLDVASNGYKGSASTTDQHAQVITDYLLGGSEASE